MSLKSTEAFHNHKEKRIADKEKALQVIINHPRITGDGMEKHMGKAFSKFSGRLTELKEEGKIYELEGSGRHSQYVAERDQQRQKELSRQYKRQKLLNKIVSFSMDVRNYARKEEMEALRNIYRRVKNDLTPTEHFDKISEQLP